MKTINNIDKMAAEYGFSICDIPSVIYKIFKEKLEKVTSVSELNSTTISSGEVINSLGYVDNELVESILKIVNPLEEIKRIHNLSQRFDEIKRNPKEIDIKSYEREINKALGILIEDGLFAFAIWLESENKEPHKVIKETSFHILKNEHINLIKNSNDLKNAVLNEISTDLQKLLLARQILERMLIYARYRAKSLNNSNEGE